MRILYYAVKFPRAKNKKYRNTTYRFCGLSKQADKLFDTWHKSGHGKYAGARIRRIN